MQDDFNPYEADGQDESGDYSDDSGTGGEDEKTIKDYINEATGRNYQSDEEALKGVKETSSYVGKVGKYKDILESLEKEQGGEAKAIEFLKAVKAKPQDTGYLTREDLDKELERRLADRDYYLDNPNLKPYDKLINAVKKPGQTIEDVVNSEDFKDIFGKLGEAKKVNKSVIHSNSRIASSTDEDYAKDFQKARETGNWIEFLEKYKGIKIS